MTDATDLTAWAQGLLDTFPSIQTPLMQGDNLAILLCQFFDDGEPNPDSDTGWSERAEAGYAEVCAGIKSHFAPVVDALIAEVAARKLAEERLAKIVNVVRPFTDVAELFDNEVEGVGAMDTLSLWLNGDDEEPAWRAMDFTLGAFGDLSAVIKEITK